MPGMYCKQVKLARIPLYGATSEGRKLTPKQVRRMLMKKSAPHPRSMKTPTGGRMTARMILQMSLEEHNRISKDDLKRAREGALCHAAR